MSFSFSFQNLWRGRLPRCLLTSVSTRRLLFSPLWDKAPSTVSRIYPPNPPSTVERKGVVASTTFLSPPSFPVVRVPPPHVAAASTPSIRIVSISQPPLNPSISCIFPVRLTRCIGVCFSCWHCLHKGLLWRPVAKLCRFDGSGEGRWWSCWLMGVLIGRRRGRASSTFTQQEDWVIWLRDASACRSWPTSLFKLCTHSGLLLFDLIGAASCRRVRVHCSGHFCCQRRDGCRRRVIWMRIAAVRLRCRCTRGWLMQHCQRYGARCFACIRWQVILCKRGGLECNVLNVCPATSLEPLKYLLGNRITFSEVIFNDFLVLRNHYDVWVSLRS